jgi:cytochrome b561
MAVSPTVYTRTAVVLHWLIGIGVLAQITLGLWMITIPKAPPGIRAGWFNVHKSIGITLAALILIRLAWRFFHRPPELPGTLSNWERIAAKANHVLLYVCMIVMPLSGYLGSSFTKYPIIYFGIKLPHWGWDSPVLKELMSQIHLTTVIIFIALIAIHVAASIKHSFDGSAGVLRRMWFRSSGDQPHEPGVSAVRQAG